MGGVGLTDEIYDGVSKMGEFAHGYTYSGHPVAAAAALANLEIIERDGLVERVGNHTCDGRRRVFLRRLSYMAFENKVDPIIKGISRYQIFFSKSKGVFLNQKVFLESKVIPFIKIFNDVANANRGLIGSTRYKSNIS